MVGIKETMELEQIFREGYTSREKEKETTKQYLKCCATQKNNMDLLS